MNIFRWLKHGEQFVLFIRLLYPSQYPVSCVDGATPYYNHTRRHTKAPTCIPTHAIDWDDSPRTIDGCLFVWHGWGCILATSQNRLPSELAKPNWMAATLEWCAVAMTRKNQKQSSNLDEVVCRTSKIQFSQGATNQWPIPSLQFIRCMQTQIRAMLVHSGLFVHDTELIQFRYLQKITFDFRGGGYRLQWVVCSTSGGCWETPFPMPIMPIHCV